MTKRKPRGICPKCGEYNWVIPQYYDIKKYMNQDGKIYYQRISETKYKCKECKYIWTETWDEGEMIYEERTAHINTSESSGTSRR